MTSVLEELARLLAAAHGPVRGIWRTDYASIRGLRLRATTTNGTSGLGVYRGRSVHWCHDHARQRFVVTETHAHR